MEEVIAVDQLRQYINKIERLEGEKSDIAEDIKQTFDEAKSHGFDVKIMRQVLRLKKKDKDSLANEEAVLDLYRSALGV